MTYDFSSTPHVISFSGFYPNYNESNQFTYNSLLNLQSCCGGSTNPNTVQNFYDNKWHHFVISFDKPNLIASFYIDNVLAQSTLVDAFDNVALNSYPIIFGAVGSSSGNISGIDGRLDNTKIYNRLLSSAEVTTLYHDTIDVPTANTTTSIYSDVNIEKRIYPNPVKDKIYINGFDNKEYSINNQYGVTVKSGIVKDESIILSDLVTGLYFLQINNSTTKIIKE
jgi:hypothetical protein